MAKAYMLRAQGLEYVRDAEGKPMVWLNVPPQKAVDDAMELELHRHGLDGGDGTAEQERWIKVVEIDLVTDEAAQPAAPHTCKKFCGKREARRMGGAAEASDGQRMVVGGVGWVQNPGDPPPPAEATPTK